MGRITFRPTLDDVTRRGNYSLQDIILGYPLGAGKNMHDLVWYDFDGTEVMRLGPDRNVTPYIANRLQTHMETTFRVQNLLGKRRLMWEDDFIGSTLDPRWQTTVTGGTVALIANQTNGICRLSTGALAGNDARLHMSGWACWNKNRSAYMEVFLPNFAGFTNGQVYIGFCITNFDPGTGPGAQSAALFRYDPSVSANWYIVWGPTAANVEDTGIALTTDQTLKILIAGLTVFAIGGATTYDYAVEKTAVGVQQHFPFIGINTTDAVDKQINIDLVALSQNRDTTPA